jgi:hypothetical protein
VTAGSCDADYLGWVYRVPALGEHGQCRAHWEQDEWSFWCHLPAGHAGPHQEAGESDDGRYIVLWDGPGLPHGEKRPEP